MGCFQRSKHGDQPHPQPKPSTEPPPRPAKELVSFHGNGDIGIHVKSAAEAKLAVKELRLRKRELANTKRLIMANERALRAQYTDKVRRHSPMMRGGHGFGRLVRAVQADEHAHERKELANKLKPLERQRERVDAMINAVDRGIVGLEKYILQES